MAGKKPNFLIFMSDQQRAETILLEHRLKAITPHLDRFRDRAVTFGDAYSPSPHCCPSRASFFTSLYPSEHGVWNNVNVTNALSRGPRPGTTFWSEDLVAAGYDLAFAGKWHVSNWQGPDAWGWRELMLYPPLGPRTSDLGEQRHAARVDELDRLAETLSATSQMEDRVAGEVTRPGWPRYVHFGVDEDPFHDAEVVQAGVDFIGGVETDQPWMLYVGTLGPHDPYTPPQRFLDLYDPADIEMPPTFSEPMRDKPALYRRTRDRFNQLSEREHREALHHYLAFCSYQDELFGRLLHSLETSGNVDGTVVLYTSDHGDYAGDFGLWGKGLPSMAGAYRIPVVLGGGPVAEWAPRGVQLPISLLDIGPTLLDLAGVPMGSSSGVSLVPWLRGDRDADETRDLFFQSNGNETYGIQRIVVSEGWKLVHNLFDYDELYDLCNDPEERVNLLVSAGLGERRIGTDPFDGIPGRLRPVVLKLFARLWRFGLDHGDENINDYILTALAPFGPGIANHSDSTAPSSPNIRGVRSAGASSSSGSAEEAEI